MTDKTGYQRGSNMAIEDPTRYVYSGMSELGLTKFFDACADAIEKMAAGSGPSEYEQQHAAKLRALKDDCLALKDKASEGRVGYPFVPRD